MLKSIEKYQKLLTGLHKERAQRINADPSLKKTLFTKEELDKEQSATETQAENNTTETSDESFQINFNEKEINQMEEMATREQIDKEDDDESVRMTQVLKLSPKELEKFNKNKKNQSGGQK